MSKDHGRHRRMTADYPTSSSGPSEEQKGLKESAQEMAAQAGEAAEKMRGQAQEFISGVAGQAQESWRGMREGLQGGWDQVSDRAGDIWSDATGFIRRYPVASVAIAFGIGCLASCAFMALPRRTDDVAEGMSRASS